MMDQERLQEMLGLLKLECQIVEVLRTTGKNIKNEARQNSLKTKHIDRSTAIVR